VGGPGEACVNEVWWEGYNARGSRSYEGGFAKKFKQSFTISKVLEQ
jgi:hypothetical protein